MYDLVTGAVVIQFQCTFWKSKTTFLFKNKNNFSKSKIKARKSTGNETKKMNQTFKMSDIPQSTVSNRTELIDSWKSFDRKNIKTKNLF